MSNIKQSKIIYSLKLFEGCDTELIRQTVIDSGTLRSFRTGEEMISEHVPSVGILLSGRAVIYSADRDRKTILRFVSPGDAVGVAGLFASDPPGTRIVACGDGKSEMFFVGRDAFESLLESETNGRFRSNLIKFLADRVSFLNSKIDYVTAGSAERKLVLYLKNAPQAPDGTLDSGMSMTALARVLDIGRASLYRALDSLEKEKIIKRNKKKIILLDHYKLDKFSD